MKEKKIYPKTHYERGEELFNIISHLVGTVLAVAAAALMIVKVSLRAADGAYPHPALAIVSICIYGAGLIILYLMSTLYHSRKEGRARAVLQRIDHCSVAILIAATYMPFTLIGLVNKGTAPTDFIWGIVIASVVLALGILVIVFNAINVHRFKLFCMIAYLLMGWCVIIRIYHVYLAIGLASFLFLLFGGIVYTVGVFFYQKKSIKYNHAIWHLFVLGGSILQFISVYWFLL